MTDQRGTIRIIEDHEHEFLSTEKAQATGRPTHLVKGRHIIAPGVGTEETHRHGLPRVNQGR